MERLTKFIPYMVICLCILGIALIAAPLARALTDKPSYFKEALLPVILGLCVEGIAFVGVLGALQDRAQANRRELLRDSLITELSFLRTAMMDGIRSSSLGKKIGEPRAGLVAAVTDLQRKSYEERKGKNSKEADWFTELAQSAVEATRDKAIVHLRRLDSVAPVAAELDASFLTDWLYITDRLVNLTGTEGFQKEQIEARGERMHWEDGVARLKDLINKLDQLGVKETYTKREYQFWRGSSWHYGSGKKH